MAVRLNDNVRQWLVDHDYVIARWLDEKDDPSYGIIFREALAKALAEKQLSPEELQKLLKGEYMKTSEFQTKAASLFGSGDRITVKDPSGRYNTTQYKASHPKYGDVRDERGEPVYLPSELDKAKTGVLFKHLARRSGLDVDFPEHERNLLDEMAMKDTWCGRMGGHGYDAIPGGKNVKALLDDSTSGGQEIVPIWFDDAIVTAPLLTGEVLPLVTIRTVPRGRQVEGASFGTPTISWGQGDATTTSLFDTSSLVAELNTTIYGCAVAVEVGRDFLSDAAVDVGALLQQRIGERMAEELDDVIVNGDGTTQPTGLDNTSSITTVSSDGGGGAAAWTAADFIELSFAIGKQYRTPATLCAFLSNDTTFSRSRQIATGVTGDTRTVMSDINDVNRYQSCGFRHIVQNDLGNASCYFGRFKDYRLYRRKGLALEMHTTGSTLARKNEVLVMARGRFGGRVMDTSAFAKITDGQA